MDYILYDSTCRISNTSPNFAGANAINRPTNGFSLLEQPVIIHFSTLTNRDASAHRVQSPYKGSGHEGRNTTSAVFNQSTLKS